MSIERTCLASHVRKIAFFVHEKLLMFVGCTYEVDLPTPLGPPKPKRPTQRKTPLAINQGR